MASYEECIKGGQRRARSPVGSAGVHVEQQNHSHVDVWAPARLHFGLFNESGLDNRVDGGAGVAVQRPAWRLRISDRDDRSPLQGSTSLFVRRAFEQVRSAFGSPPLCIREIQSVPSHVGLGSKTSLSMAIGRALADLTGTRISDLEIARLANRGGTSGVGVHVSRHGGFVIDAGHLYPRDKSKFGPSNQVLAQPPNLRKASASAPDWVILHFNLGGIGLHGQEEKEFFDRVCPIPNGETRTILQLVDSLLIPGLENQDIALLHSYLDKTQHLGLKGAEWTLQGRAVQSLRGVWTERRRVDTLLAPLCLSSMGPTLFLITCEPDRELSTLDSIGIRREIVTKTSIPASGVMVRSEK
jgi:beta-ribofuranosylaminobenzene 5'-phosphate synthase